jgi:hypothetical protein
VGAKAASSSPKSRWFAGAGRIESAATVLPQEISKRPSREIQPLHSLLGDLVISRVLLRRLKPHIERR